MSENEAGNTQRSAFDDEPTVRYPAETLAEVSARWQADIEAHALSSVSDDEAHALERRRLRSELALVKLNVACVVATLDDLRRELDKEERLSTEQFGSFCSLVSELSEAIL